MNVRLVKFCAQPSTFAICRAHPEEAGGPDASNDPKWPQMTILEGPFWTQFTKHQRNRGNFWNNDPKGPPNGPRWPFLRTLFRPHITKHQRNRGNFWNNGPKVTLLNPKPCRFYWYLTQNDPKSALNDPKSDPKLSTCIFGAVQNNEIFAPHLHWTVILKSTIPWKHKTHVGMVRKVHHFGSKMRSSGTTFGELLDQKPIESAY
jgi:hypothetical protein